MKKCSVCGSEKVEALFNFDKSRQRLYAACRACHCIKAKAWRDRQPPGKLGKEAHQRTVAVRNWTKVFLQQYKQGKPCLDCGIPYPSYVLDFDHVRGTKRFNVSSYPYGLTALKTELDKCELVCANCHRERTHARKRVHRAGLEPAADRVIAPVAQPIELSMQSVVDRREEGWAKRGRPRKAKT